MKKTILTLLLLSMQLLYSQTQEPPTSVSNPMDNIKQLYPAAPTANNLMKFEEVPVSYYTGVPDIKIPITAIPTGGPAMNVSLNYHPLNAKPDDKAGETGLGWSLLAGGSITRTVRSGPDDNVVLSSLGAQLSLGIYFDEYTTNYTLKNYTRKYLDAITSGGVQPADTEKYRKLLYEALFHNRYDTEYDLYQYNFMGYTGRFIIKKNSGNQLFVEKLDKNNLKIAISATNPNRNFEAIAFIITDEQGNKYTFDVVERSTRNSLAHKQGFKGRTSTNASDLGTTPSAFHLSKITNSSDVVLATLNYYPQKEVFYTDGSQISRRKHTEETDVLAQPVSIQFDGEIPAALENNSTQTATQICSLKSITVPDKGKISFTYLEGREDTNYSHPQQLQKLDKIKVLNASGKTLETYELAYSYFNFPPLNGTLPEARLSLTKITKYNSASVKDFDYVFNYNENTANAALGKDHWEWFNCPRFKTDPASSRSVSPGCISTNILKSIKLPSGGLRVFDFGANTYSYDNNGQAITNFDENTENWSYTDTQNITLQSNSTPFNTAYHNLGIDSRNRTLVLEKAEVENNNGGGTLHLEKLNSNNQPILPQTTIENATGEYILEAGYNYRFRFFWSSTDYPGEAHIEYAYKSRASVQKPFLYGGGIRINSISYFDQPTDAVPAKKVNFTYNDRANPEKSSGALVFPKPVHSYQYPYTNNFVWACTAMGGQCIYPYTNVFTIYSSQNFLPAQKTQGSDVGYQNISVSETGNGESTYTYVSPIDEPNEYLAPNAPTLIPITNYDYKRGLLTLEQKKNNTGSLLYKKTSQYNTYDTEALTGISLRHRDTPYSEYIYAGQFKTYESYMTACMGGNNNAYCNDSDPITMIAVTNGMEIIGKANPTHSESTEYPEGNVVTTSQETTYNTRDYPIKQKTISTDGTIDETYYNYAHEKGNTKLINANMIGVPLETSVISKQNSADPGKILSKAETKYDNPANLFPTSVVSYNLSNVASTEVTYDLYDSKGNLLQYTAKDGIVTSIIWGYNSTQPIAQVTGISYSTASALAADIISASNNDATDPANEGALISALDTFRKQSAFLNAQVTTYTYDLLTGVTSITQPSGMREIYLYDTTQRLKEIKQQEKDASGNLIYKTVKEFKYNYKH